MLGDKKRIDKQIRVKAALFYEPKVPFKIETLDLEPPRAGEVLVKVAAAGVCHSDWHLMTGATRYATPVVPGHEGAGVVEAVRRYDHPPRKDGDRFLLRQRKPKT